MATKAKTPAVKRGKIPTTPPKHLPQLKKTPTAQPAAKRPVGRPRKVVETAPPPSPPSEPSPISLASAELAARVLARRHLIPFTKRFNPRYKAGWVHNDICRRLERFSREVAEGKSPRLMILMPPRHGKSELASRNFPAWHLGHYPEHEFIACSYNIDLARGFSRKVKAIIDDPAYGPIFPETRLDPDNASNEAWGIHQHPGGYVAAGVGGGITGKGAHVLLIDDPIKNAEEADSPDVREKIWEWYLSTAYSRLAPGGGVLIIQTWWHDDDLAGKLQTLMKKALEGDDADAEYIDQFDVVKYPAIAEADEYLNPKTDEILWDPSADDIKNNSLTKLRTKGEALHTERYDIHKLLRIKAQNNGGRWWSALYQQNPVPEDGGYFKKEQFRVQAAPRKEDCNVFIAWDFAISEKKQNDYTVGVVGLQNDDDLLNVAEVVRFRSADSFFIVEAILNMVARWYSPRLLVGFEDGQIFRAIESLLKKRMKERRMTFAIEVLKPITDKMARARALQGRMQQGMVNFAPGPWYDVLRTEMLRFPAGAHDDQVDACAWMATMVVNKLPPAKPREKILPSWRDKLSGLGMGTVGHMAA